MRQFLTLKRATFYAALIFIAGLSITVPSLTKERLSAHSDFPAFYNAGRIINRFPTDRLYDPILQQDLYKEVAPTARGKLFFAYTPFFALVFSPLAHLPFVPAFIAWAIISTILFIVGFSLVWSAYSLPANYRTSALVISFSFLPFYTWTLLSGQTSAFGFFALALAIYLDRKNRVFASGCVLALLLYKPPLVLLIALMLIITKRRRTLMGLGVGGAVLATISIALIGFSGVSRYLNMLKYFSELSAQSPNGREIDALSFWLPFISRPASYVALIIIAALVLPFIIKAWRERPDLAWIHAIVWTAVLNLYFLLYDSTLIILAVVIAASSVRELPKPFRWLLVALFLIPWVESHSANLTGFRPMTIAIVAFGIYLLRLRNDREVIKFAVS